MGMPPRRSSSQRRDRLIREKRHDAYRATGHLPEPTSCPECRASYRDGRWTWERASVDAHKTLCPACRRIKDDYPGGWVNLSGSFLGAKRDEIVQCIRHTEERQCRDHPMKRIIAVWDDADGLVVTTTDPHLARAIGSAVRSAYAGELEYQYAKGEDELRVSWKRDVE